MDAEVIVVGAGFSGACAAYVLGKQGVDVLALDRHEVFPNIFRAEKLEVNQAQALARLGLLDYRRPLAGPIGNTINYVSGKASDFDTLNQFGINYADTVNSFRDALRQHARFTRAKVTDIKLGEDIQTVVTDGKTYTCRLVVLAAGGSDVLLKKVGISRKTDNTLNSLSFAFDIRPKNSTSFPFNGFNYFLSDHSNGVDYATIFRVGETMRVNVFTQWRLPTSKLISFKSNPELAMEKYFPDLLAQIGPFQSASKVQAFPTNFYRLKGIEKPGIVVIGDDYQSVSPTTGSGLDKVTTDVERLCNTHIPAWLQTPKMERDKIATFYRDSHKRAVDNMSLGRWVSYRDMHRGFWGKQFSRVELKIKHLLGLW